jgi:hypothetical protein
MVILVHAGLLVRSHWQGDEYLVVARLREEGWHSVLLRYWGWSGRIVSDVLFGIYGAAVNVVHRPLAVWCDALLWVLLLAFCLSPAWLGHLVFRWRRMAMAFALLALFLLGHGVNEVFYWPAAALAYVPTLAGSAMLFWCVVDGMEKRRFGVAAALVLIGGSSEVGLFLAGAFAGLVILRVVFGGARVSLADVVCVLPGMAVALLDAFVVMRSRVQVAGALGGGSATFHHAAASLVAAAPAYFLDAFAGEAGAAVWPAALAHAVGYVLVAVGARWCLALGPRIAVRGPYLPVLAGALVLAGFASEAAAFYQFGEACCERHETMRQCFLFLAFASAGAWWGMVSPPEFGIGARWGSAPLLVAVVLMGAPRLPEILAEYRLIPRVLTARTLTWRSGLGAGNMVFVNEPDGILILGAGLPLGFYKLDMDTGDAHWAERGVMEFFEKRNLRVVALGR